MSTVYDLSLKAAISTKALQRPSWKPRQTALCLAHYHTAVEQLMIVRGEVATGMEGMSTVALGPGGFAMMPSKRVHWFTCSGKEECLMFVTFDRAYDVVWVKRK
jgi:quercetin dioxygenase-like cupin family protein